MRFLLGFEREDRLIPVGAYYFLDHLMALVGFYWILWPVDLVYQSHDRQ
jgi:hypothetical protein